MPIKSCIPLIPSADLEKSLRFWVDGVGLTMDRPMRRDGKLIGCMVHNEHVWLWLNERGDSKVNPADYEGIRLYWAPDDLHAQHTRLIEAGFSPSEIDVRDYGQTEFFVTDHDGHSHCFGVATKSQAVS